MKTKNRQELSLPSNIQGIRKEWDPLSPEVRTFTENDPNKSCRGHEVLSFGDLEIDLELDLEDHLKVNFNFLNGNPLFRPRI